MPPPRCLGFSVHEAGWKVNPEVTGTPVHRDGSPTVPPVAAAGEGSAEVLFMALFDLEFGVEFFKIRTCTARFSVQVKSVFVVQLQGRVLIFLPQEAIADHQDLGLCAHEAAEGVFRRAYNGLSAHIKGGV